MARDSCFVAVATEAILIVRQFAAVKAIEKISSPRKKTTKALHVPSASMLIVKVVIENAKKKK